VGKGSNVPSSSGRWQVDNSTANPLNHSQLYFKAPRAGKIFAKKVIGFNNGTFTKYVG
jgi:hypothetical protein